MVQCKFRVKIISVIFKIHVCLHWAMSWPVSSFFHGRREWMGLICCHFYFQSSPLQKILALKAAFVKRGLPIQRLTVKNSPSISTRTWLCSSEEQNQFSTPQTSFTSSSLSVPLFPLHIDQMKWSPYQFYSENLWQVNRSIDRPQEWNSQSISSFSGGLSTFQGTSDLK